MCDIILNLRYKYSEICNTYTIKRDISIRKRDIYTKYRDNY